MDPSRSWPPQEQERPGDNEEDEAEMDDEDNVREEAVQHLYMLHPRRTSLTAPPSRKDHFLSGSSRVACQLTTCQRPSRFTRVPLLRK